MAGYVLQVLFVGSGGFMSEFDFWFFDKVNKDPAWVYSLDFYHWFLPGTIQGIVAI